MDINLENLKVRAFNAKDYYKVGLIDRDEARCEIMPYIDAFNEVSKKIAKKYNQRPRMINFNKFIR